MKLLVLVLALAACGSSPPSSGSNDRAVAAGPPLPAGARVLRFPAGDGVTVTAEVYAPHPPTAPLVVLFHQAGASRGEYRTIAPRLNTLGFNAMAVDARSGDTSQGVGNETTASAAALGKPRAFVDAIADLQAAVATARKDLARGKLIVWGSSYSSALVLVLGHALAADAVIAFSPGEYFEDQGKPKTWVADNAKALTVPVFITSAKSEGADWAPIAAAIAPGLVTTFVPETEGHHGSSVLWPTQPDAEAYWTAVGAFLAAHGR